MASLAPTPPPFVLIADHEAAIRELVCEALEQAGFEAVGVADGEALVMLARRRPPQVIVLDVVMPRMGGYTAMLLLRGDPATRDVPVVLVTAELSPHFQILSASMGAAAHITKPLALGDLTALVRQVLAGVR